MVVKGDTLWDISAKFLTDPWKWWDIWEKNPQIDNPDLIFPGDIITLIYVDGKPQLVVNRGKQIQGTGKLSPTIRDIEIEEAIHVIPLEAIRQFLSKPKIVGPHQLEKAHTLLIFPKAVLSEAPETESMFVLSNTVRLTRTVSLDRGKHTGMLKRMKF